MASVFDVAAYILAKSGPMSAMKLQKLVYYSQAWSLAWDEVELFPEEIEAWANGPVVRELYEAHRGRYRVFPAMVAGDASRLTVQQKDTVDRVLAFYGDKDPQWLSDLTHLEAPWRDARRGVAEGEPSSAVIAKDVLLEYYSSL